MGRQVFCIPLRVHNAPQLASDEYYLREACSKDSRANAGLRRVRNSRCNFKQQLAIANSTGATFHMAFHVACTLPKSLQKSKQPKWPSKKKLTQERRRMREDKEMDAYPC